MRECGKAALGRRKGRLGHARAGQLFERRLVGRADGQCFETDRFGGIGHRCATAHFGEQAVGIALFLDDDLRKPARFATGIFRRCCLIRSRDFGFGGHGAGGKTATVELRELYHPAFRHCVTCNVALVVIDNLNVRQRRVRGERSGRHDADLSLPCFKHQGGIGLYQCRRRAGTARNGHEQHLGDCFAAEIRAQLIFRNPALRQYVEKRRAVELAVGAVESSDAGNRAIDELAAGDEAIAGGILFERAAIDHLVNSLFGAALRDESCHVEFGLFLSRAFELCLDPALRFIFGNGHAADFCNRAARARRAAEHRIAFIKRHDERDDDKSKNGEAERFFRKVAEECKHGCGNPALSNDCRPHRAGL